MNIFYIKNNVFVVILVVMSLTFIGYAYLFKETHGFYNGFISYHEKHREHWVITSHADSVANFSDFRRQVFNLQKEIDLFDHKYKQMSARQIQTATIALEALILDTKSIQKNQLSRIDDNITTWLDVRKDNIVIPNGANYNYSSLREQISRSMKEVSNAFKNLESNFSKLKGIYTSSIENFDEALLKQNGILQNIRLNNLYIFNHIDYIEDRLNIMRLRHKDAIELRDSYPGEKHYRGLSENILLPALICSFVALMMFLLFMKNIYNKNLRMNAKENVD